METSICPLASGVLAMAWMEPAFRRASLFGARQHSSVGTDSVTSDSWAAVPPPLPLFGSGREWGCCSFSPISPAPIPALPQPSSPASPGDASGGPADRPDPHSPLLRPAFRPWGARCRPGSVPLWAVAVAGRSQLAAQGTPGPGGVPAGRTIAITTALLLHDGYRTPEALRVLTGCLRARDRNHGRFSS